MSTNDEQTRYYLVKMAYIDNIEACSEDEARELALEYAKADHNLQASSHVRVESVLSAEEFELRLDKTMIPWDAVLVDRVFQRLQQGFMVRLNPQDEDYGVYLDYHKRVTSESFWTITVQSEGQRPDWGDNSEYNKMFWKELHYNFQYGITPAQARVVVQENESIFRGYLR